MLSYVYFCHPASTYPHQQDRERKSTKSPKSSPRPDKGKRKSKKERPQSTTANPQEVKQSPERSRSKSPNGLRDKDWTMVPFDDYLKLKSTIEFQRSKIAELTNR